MSERDPLQDPKPGDVVRGDLGETRRVEHRHRGNVLFRVTENAGAGYYCSLRKWRAWAAGAEVVAAAGTEG